MVVARRSIAILKILINAPNNKGLPCFEKMAAERCSLALSGFQPASAISS